MSEDSKQITITLNGTRTPAEHRKYSYAEIYKLAWPDLSLPTDENEPITYQMPHQHEKKTLTLNGELIELKEGMVIDVSAATRS